MSNKIVIWQHSGWPVITDVSTAVLENCIEMSILKDLRDLVVQTLLKLVVYGLLLNKVTLLSMISLKYEQSCDLNDSAITLATPP